MKKLLLVVFLVSLMYMPSLKADTCSDDVLSDASKVKMEAIPIVTEEDAYFQIKISNLTPNVYVTVYEDDNETTTTYKYEDAVDGVIIIDHYYIYEKVNYRVEVYSTNSDECKEKLNTLEASTKVFNERFNLTVCRENPDYERCEVFYEETEEEKKQTNVEFRDEVEEYERFKNMSILEKAWYYIKKYGLYVLIPLVVIGGGYTVAIVVYKRKKEGDEK